MKHSNNTTGNRTRNLLACSAEPQPKRSTVFAGTTWKCIKTRAQLQMQYSYLSSK